MQCPSCQASMTSHAVDGYLGARVEIDRCDACHLFWFDQRESLRLSPRATLRLLQLVGEAAGQPRAPLSAVLRCPRCAAHLLVTHDRQRNVAFQYHRCPNEHGRLTTDLDFLREKNVVRPLSAEQIAELRQSVQFVSCSNCGAPVDLAAQSACSHCGSPLSVVDLQQAGTVIEQLRSADRADGPIDPLLPLRLAEARREVEQSFAALGYGHARHGEGPASDLLSAGLSALARWLRE